jgi:hypothetical protein
MSNLNRSLYNFYMLLLEQPYGPWRVKHKELYAATRFAVAKELGVSEEEAQATFERIVDSSNGK